MRSPSVNDNHSSSHEINSTKQPTTINELSINNPLMDYSLSELQKMASHQQEQIKYNQKLLLSRERRLKHLKQQQTFRYKRFNQQVDMKYLRLKTLENEFNQQKTSNSTSVELTKTIGKIDELTKQLEQVKRLKLTLTKEQSQNKNELDKLKQELLIRNKLNEQQHRQIAYQRQIYTSKHTELNQLNYRIENIQQCINKKKISQSIGFKSALDNVQNTLKSINIAEIEKRMVQLANSFNSINTSSSTITNQNDQINNLNKTTDGSLSIPSSKKAFASNSEIATTYMTRSLCTSVSSSLVLTDLPMITNESVTDTIDSLSSKPDEQLLPPNLRLNDDILSVRLNNVTSNVKKRHSLSDPCDSLVKCLPSNAEQQQPIQVRDDSLINSEPISVACENLLDCSNKINSNKSSEEDTIMESFISDTESEGSLSDDIDSTISFPITLPSSLTDLKSLLKTSTTPKNTSRRVIFDPLALLLDAAVIGEVDLVIKSAKEVENPSQPNDEGLTALHNAVCAANIECVKFLVEFGCNINYADNDGWTPLHCAASCNQTTIVEFLIKHGACIYATTIRDNETAAEKCEEDEENYSDCLKYLLNVQNDLGVINDGLVYALYDYDPDCSVNDELRFRDGDQMKILRRGDENENEWWWAKHINTEKEGYVPRNYFGLYPRVRSSTMSLTNH